MIDPITEHILLEDVNKKIEKLKRKIQKMQEKKKKCPSMYDEVLCISRLNQMIADTRVKIKKLKQRKR